jgi:hypothetical protein
MGEGVNMKEKMQRINLSDFDLNKNRFSASTIACINQFVSQNRKNLTPEEIEEIKSIFYAKLSVHSIDDDEQICDSQEEYNTQSKRFR